MGADAVFRVEGLRKSFGHNEVLGGISLDLFAGEVTVLMGANGAGKSTLVKIISGVYERGGGTMRLASRAFDPKTPAEAIRAGVVTVHQNINDGVVADLDVATNLTLDRLSGKAASVLFKPANVRAEAKAVADRMGLAINLRARVADLSLADRQMVAIARAMAHQPKVLILDEPTSSLSSAEADRLFSLIDRLRGQGVAILYISHRMSDIRRLAERIVSMRDGVISGGFNIERNISLPFLKRMSDFGVMKRRAERAAARRQIGELGIVCRSEKDELSALSGGNQQKVMVARWMSQSSRLFILDEPFQGVDISARRDIAAKLRASADGRATLIFVTELD